MPFAAAGHVTEFPVSKGKTMKELQRQLGRMFAGGSRPQRDTSRRSAVSAKLAAEAAAAGCAVEAIDGGGFNVWPPEGIADDPFEGDHYANDSAEARHMIRSYGAAK